MSVIYPETPNPSLQCNRCLVKIEVKQDDFPSRRGWHVLQWFRFSFKNWIKGAHFGDSQFKHEFGFDLCPECSESLNRWFKEGGKIERILRE